jgi:hypothetical protein
MGRGISDLIVCFVTKCRTGVYVLWWDFSSYLLWVGFWGRFDSGATDGGSGLAGKYGQQYVLFSLLSEYYYNKSWFLFTVLSMFYKLLLH